MSFRDKANVFSEEIMYPIMKYGSILWGAYYMGRFQDNSSPLSLFNALGCGLIYAGLDRTQKKNIESKMENLEISQRNKR